MPPGAPRHFHETAVAHSSFAPERILLHLRGRVAAMKKFKKTQARMKQNKTTEKRRWDRADADARGLSRAALGLGTRFTPVVTRKMTFV